MPASFEEIMRQRRQQQMASLRNGPGGVGGGGGGGDPETVGFQHPQGTAEFYADSYKVLRDALRAGKDPGDVYLDILSEFKGSEGDLENFMKRAAPFLAQGLRGSAGFQHAQDPSNWDMGAMGAYGSGAGMIGQAGAQAMRAGQGALGRMGLGRSAGMAALAQQATQQTGGQQAGLFSNLFQQAQQNRMMNANRAYEMNRDIAQLALGQQPTPRIGGGGGPSQAQAGLSGAMAGAGAGAAFGPWGAGIGAIIGGAGGLLT